MNTNHLHHDGEKTMFYAHIREDGKVQTVEEHLRGTAERCARFASRFGEEERGYMLGYAHDIGKCSAAFQKRLLGGAKVDHSTAGALECALKGGNLPVCVDKVLFMGHLFRYNDR